MLAWGYPTCFLFFKKLMQYNASQKVHSKRFSRNISAFPRPFSSVMCANYNAGNIMYIYRAKEREREVLAVPFYAVRWKERGPSVLDPREICGSL